MIDIEMLHHVALPVADLARAKAFYADVIGLAETERPPFDFPGAWFTIAGGATLHLIVSERQTFRAGKPLDSRDIHVAIRVRSFRGALAHLAERGYSGDSADEMKRIKVTPAARAGFAQIFLLDPDRNVVELNAERASS